MSTSPAVAFKGSVGFSYQDADNDALDVSQLLPGLYFVRIEKEGKLIVKKFVKE